MKPFEYARPKDMSELLEILQVPGYHILAGGTDLLPKIHSGSTRVFRVVDISAINEMTWIEEKDDRIQIGALVTFAGLMKNKSVQEHAPSLIEAIRLIGAPMTRARGTIGGNIANASPAGDTLTPLLTFNASITLKSLIGTRMLRLEGFFLGPGQNAINQGEIIEQITLEKPTGRWGSSFQKVGPRRGMTIAIVNTAVLLNLDEEDQIDTARIALGALAPTPICCHRTEKILCGKKAAALPWEEIFDSIQTEIKPIDDLRGTKDYRKSLAKTLLKRAIFDANETALRRN